MKACYTLSKVEGYTEFVFSRKLLTDKQEEVKATRIISKEEAEMYLGRAMMKGLEIEHGELWDTECWKWMDGLE